ncbi:MAG: hypothetical protein KatS3mg126_0136 [Lysobacteraceae bacterium]|nr:MAG: hypothetical protein KatS3mg126_0136 [Xanthomonadaceae bacterium]
MPAMVPVPATLPERPTDVGAQVNAAFRTFGTHARAVFAPALAGQLLALLPYLAMPEVGSEPAAAAELLDWLARPATWALLVAVSVAQLHLSCVILYRLGCRGRGRDPGLPASFQHGLQRTAAAVASLLLYLAGLAAASLPFLLLVGLAAASGQGALSGLLALAALFSCALPVWWSLAAGLALPAVVLERRGPIAAIGRSLALVRGSWWRISVVLGVVLLVHLAVSMVLGTVLAIAAMAGLASAPGTGGPGSGWMLALQLLLSPVNALLLILLFSGLLAVFNDRVRAVEHAASGG